MLKSLPKTFQEWQAACHQSLMQHKVLAARCSKSQLTSRCHVNPKHMPRLVGHPMPLQCLKLEGVFYMHWQCAILHHVHAMIAAMHTVRVCMQFWK